MKLQGRSQHMLPRGLHLIPAIILTAALATIAYLTLTAPSCASAAGQSTSATCVSAAAPPPNTTVYLPLVSIAVPPQGATIYIDVNDFTFNPDLRTIKAGDTVVWLFKGYYPHNVTASNSAFNSANLRADTNYTRTFSEPGVYQYYCTLHGNARGKGMSAVIVVEPSDRVAPGPGPQQPAPTSVPVPTSAPAPTAVPPPPAAPGTTVIAMEDFSFGPQVVSITVGDTVRWSHVGSFPHTVQADSQAWGSAELNTGEIYERVFSAPGTYAYYCTLHGSAGGVGMAGVIQVQSPGSPPLPTPTPPPPAPPTPTLPPPPPAPAGTTDVSTIDFSFAPRTVTVSVGATIRWINTGRAAHTVTSSSQPWDSGRMDSGAAFQRTFTAPGTYPYYCLYHGTSGGGGMAGTIIVQGTGPAPVGTPAPTQPPLPPASAPYLSTALSGGPSFPAATGTATYDNRSGQPQFRLELRAGQSYQSAGVDIFIDGVKVAEAVVNDKGECRLELRSTNGDTVPAIAPGARLVMRLSNGTLLATGTF